MKLKLRYILGKKARKASVDIVKEDNRLVFKTMSPFEFKDEVKAMQGWKFNWDKKQWSVEDCYRNQFQLQAMMGQPVYEPWEKPIEHFEPNRGPDWGPDWYQGPLKHQQEMINFALTRRYANLAVDMGLGKTLSMIEAMELSGIKDWWWIAPKSGMKSLKRELEKWGIDPSINLRQFTYEALREFVKNEWPNGKVFPQGIIFDECRKLSQPKTGWTIAAQAVADNIRYKYGWDGMVITMSGTTNAETPVDIWSQIEVTWPGFLREGSRTAFEYRLGIYQKRENEVGESYQARICMLDDERKCKTCGEFKEDHPTESGCKRWLQSVNEVALVAERLEGIQLVQKKEDCLDLPEKRYREVIVKPSSSTLRAARAMVRAAPSTITGLNWLRQLADGFAYKPSKGELVTCTVCHGTGERKKFTSLTETKDQTKTSYQSEMIECEKCGGSGTNQRDDRETTKVTCPKDDALRDLLAENYEHGRICIFASYHGSIDRCEEVALSEGWDVFHVDGRGWSIKTLQGIVKGDPLDYWADVVNNKRVAFIAHPKSGGMGLTLTEARMAVYYSNPYSADDRLQSEDRIHRIGCDPNRGVEIVDIIHLDSDRMVRDALLSKQKLEKMSLGILDFGDEDGEEGTTPTEGS